MAPCGLLDTKLYNDKGGVYPPSQKLDYPTNSFFTSPMPTKSENMTTVFNFATPHKLVTVGNHCGTQTLIPEEVLSH